MVGVTVVINFIAVFSEVAFGVFIDIALFCLTLNVEHSILFRPVILYVACNTYFLPVISPLPPPLERNVAIEHCVISSGGSSRRCSSVALFSHARILG